MVHKLSVLFFFTAIHMLVYGNDVSFSNAENHKARRAVPFHAMPVKKPNANQGKSRYHRRLFSLKSIDIQSKGDVGRDELDFVLPTTEFPTPASASGSKTGTFPGTPSTAEIATTGSMSSYPQTGTFPGTPSTAEIATTGSMSSHPHTGTHSGGSSVTASFLSTYKSQQKLQSLVPPEESQYIFTCSSFTDQYLVDSISLEDLFLNDTSTDHDTLMNLLIQTPFPLDSPRKEIRGPLYISAGCADCIATAVVCRAENCGEMCKKPESEQECLNCFLENCVVPYTGCAYGIDLQKINGSEFRVEGMSSAND